MVPVENELLRAQVAEMRLQVKSTERDEVREFLEEELKLVRAELESQKKRNCKLVQELRNAAVERKFIIRLQRKFTDTLRAFGHDRSEINTGF